MKSIVTDFMDNCIICGKPTNIAHHLVFGRGMRPLADDDLLVIPICPECHNMNGKLSIHGNNVSCALSRIAGQLAKEKQIIHETGCGTEESRVLFRNRYGVSYL